MEEQNELEFDDDEEEEEEDDNRTSIRKDLAHLSYEELEQLKEKIGTKMYNEAMFGTSSESNKNFKRENKNRPRELSSKKPVKVLREVFKTKRKKTRDPRFDDLSGEYNDLIFQQSYAFIDEIKHKEKMELKKQLKMETNENKKMKMEKLLNRIENQEKEQKRKAEVAGSDLKIKQEMIKDLKQGKKPYFMKNSERKKLQFLTQFKELKKSGKLEKYIQKKRKRNASKDSHWLKKNVKR